MAADKTLDFSSFDTNLLRTVEGLGNVVIIDAMMDGAAALRNDFAVRTMRDKAALVSVEFQDAFKAASDSFEGRKGATIRSRYVSFTEGDIDIEIKMSDVKELYRSYLGWIIAPDRSEAEIRDNPFEVFFIRRIIANHFAFIRTKTAWKGAINNANIGANNIADGLLVKTAASRTSGEIVASHVFTAATTIDVTNAYDQVNGVADLIKSTRPEMLNMELECKLSQSVYDLYRKNRRALFSQHVGPGEKPTELDDYSNIKFKIDPGLAGKSTIMVTPHDNLVFAGNEDPGTYYINIVRQVKSWQLTVRVSLAFDFASPDLIFLNDKV
ncbi:hypothetical protein BLX24_30335 [Arsenicibacter rosenii]|uniref:Phage capsid protein n=2 Tax=Arsenicibacter rosenii TaxID=1750698 RepID=A0A1S2V9P6_9BACT|nr:hypothetical protein BLX24_30335 [Arsenicibacter rosenii]